MCGMQMDGDSGQAGNSQAEGQQGQQKELQLNMQSQEGDLEECAQYLYPSGVVPNAQNTTFVSTLSSIYLPAAFRLVVGL